MNSVMIDGVEYVRRTDPAATKHHMVRSRDAGVFVGTIESRDGAEVTMTDARRIWYWDGAASLSEGMVDGAMWTGPDGATVPVAEIVDFGYGDGPMIYALGPLTEPAEARVERLEAELLTLRKALVAWDFAGDGTRSRAESAGHTLRDRMVDYLCAEFDADRPYIAVDHLIGIMSERQAAGDEFLFDVIPEDHWGLRTEGDQ